MSTIICEIKSLGMLYYIQIPEGLLRVSYFIPIFGRLSSYSARNVLEDKISDYKKMPFMRKLIRFSVQLYVLYWLCAHNLTINLNEEKNILTGHQRFSSPV